MILPTATGCRNRSAVRLQQTINTALFYDVGLVSHYGNGQRVVSYPFGAGVGHYDSRGFNISMRLVRFGQRLSLKDAKFMLVIWAFSR